MATVSTTAVSAPRVTWASRPVAASGLLRPLLVGPVRPLAFAVAGAHAVHLSTGDANVPLLSLVPADGVRLPGAVLVADGPPARDAVRQAGGQDAAIGAGVIRVGQIELVPRRWWDGTRVRRCLEDDLGAGLAALAAAAVGVRPADAATRAATERLTSAVTSRSIAPRTVNTAVEAMIGLGPGLTPAGDDVLVGALLTWYALEPGRPEVVDVRALVAAVVSRSTTQTTAVSAALLTHAIRGEGIPDVVALVHALADPVRIRAAAHEVVGIGHDSGSSMLRGVLLATRFACRSFPVSGAHHSPAMLVG